MTKCGYIKMTLFMVEVTGTQEVEGLVYNTWLQPTCSYWDPGLGTESCCLWIAVNKINIELCGPSNYTMKHYRWDNEGIDISGYALKYVGEVLCN